MAKKIIVLNKVTHPSYFEVNYVFWLVVPAAQIPYRVNASATSVYKDATTAEVQDIKDGKVQEVSGMLSFTLGTAVGAIGSRLVTEYNKEQAKLNACQQFNYFGTYYDGSAWTIQGA